MTINGTAPTPNRVQLDVKDPAEMRNALIMQARATQGAARALYAVLMDGQEMNGAALAEILRNIARDQGLIMLGLAAVLHTEADQRVQLASSLRGVVNRG